MVKEGNIALSSDDGLTTKYAGRESSIIKFPKYQFMGFHLVAMEAGEIMISEQVNEKADSKSGQLVVQMSRRA
jgi:hypothetical protein